MKLSRLVFPFALVLVSVLGAAACSESGSGKKGGDTPAAVATVEKASAPTAAPQPTATAPGKKVEVLASGTVSLPEGSKATGKMLFVSLRGVEGRGPPIAALRLPAGPFPLKFEITTANVVAMGGQARPVPAKFMLKASLDVDGNPMQKSPDDHIATQAVAKGTSDLKLVLAPAGK